MKDYPKLPQNRTPQYIVGVVAVLIFCVAGWLAYPQISFFQKEPSSIGRKDDPSPQKVIESPHRPVAKGELSDLSGRPSDHQMTAEKKEFWDYMETFNRLPNKPIKPSQSIFVTTGAPPVFHYLSTSKLSVFGNIEGALAHRDTFKQRYVWVSKLLKKYDISLNVDKKLFTGSARQVCIKYGSHVENKLQLSNRRKYVEQWLECLLIVDYIYARGSNDDRKRGVQLMHHVFSVPGLGYRRIEKMVELGHEMEVPASYQICMALLNDFSIDASEQLVAFPSMTFRYCLMPELWVNYNKWVLRVKSFEKWQSLRQLCRVDVGNCYVQNQLLTAAIYWHHSHDTVKPENGWADIAVKELFKRIYGKHYKLEYQKYTKLLNDAYPSK